MIRDALLNTKEEVKGSPSDVQIDQKKKADLAQQLSQAIFNIEIEFKEIKTLYKRREDEDNGLSDSQKHDLHTKLKLLGSNIEKTRVQLEQSIFPRDIDLKVIDIQIQNQETLGELKKSQQKVVTRDLFTAYDRCLEYDEKIKEEAKKKTKEEEKAPMISEEIFNGQNQLQTQDILGLTEIDIATAKFTVPDDFVEQKNIKPQPKNRITKKQDFGNKQEEDQQVSVAKRFYPALKNDDEAFLKVESIEFNFIFKMQRISLQYYELELSLLSVNTSNNIWKYQQLSQTGIIECRQLPYGRMSNPNYLQVFVNLSLQQFLTEDVSLMIKVISKRESLMQANIRTTLGTEGGNATHRYLKAFHALPISKLLWANALKVGDSYFVQQAPMYLVPENMQVEPNYLELMQNRKLRKSKDLDLTQALNLNYLYKIEDMNFMEKLEKCISDDKLTMISEVGINIVRGFDFEKLMLKSNNPDYINYLKYRLNRYPFNEIKLILKNVIFTDSIQTKSKVFRLEVALRDQRGNVHQKFYKTMCDTNFSMSQTYESLIYPVGHHDTKINEVLFLRIPTNDVEYLRDLNIFIMLQTLVNINDARGKSIKIKRVEGNLQSMQFKTEYIGMIPLFDSKTNQIIGGEVDYQILFQKLKGKKQSYIPPTFEAMIPMIEQTNAKLIFSISLISTEFTLNQKLNSFFLLKNNSPPKIIEQLVRSIEENRDSNELILLHEKILDKLFSLVNQPQNLSQTKIPHQIFRAIISMFDVFDDNKQFSQIYSQLIENFIQNSFNYPQLYIFLIQQLEYIAPLIGKGITQIERSTDQGHNNGGHQKEFKQNPLIIDDSQIGSTTLKTIKNLHHILMLINHSFDKYVVNYLKKGINGLANIPLEKNEQNPNLMSSLIKNITREIGAQIEKPILQIFQTCHEERNTQLSKAILTLRGYLYQNLTLIIESIANIVEPELLQSIMNLISRQQLTSSKYQNRGDQKDIIQNSEIDHFSATQIQANRRDTTTQSIINNENYLLPSFFEERFFHNPYEKIQWIINQDNLNQILVTNIAIFLRSDVVKRMKFIFFESAIRFFKKFSLILSVKKELSLHVHYFFFEFSKFIFAKDLHNSMLIKGESKMLYQYQKEEIQYHQHTSAILIFTFYSQNLHQIFINSHLDTELKKLGIPESNFNPIRDKLSLVYLEAIQYINETQIEALINSSDLRFSEFLQSMQSLIESISFKDYFNQYFQLRKLQIFHNIFQIISKIFIEKYAKAENLNQKELIYDCIERCLISLFDIALQSLSLLRKHKQIYIELGITEDLIFSDNLNDMVYLTEIIFKTIRVNWIQIKSSVNQYWKIMSNEELKMNFVEIFNFDAGINKTSAFLTYMIIDSIEIEYLKTQQIQANSNLLLQIIYELKSSKRARENVLSMFMHRIQSSNFINQSPQIQGLIKKMLLLNQDIQSLNLCYEKYPSNSLCLGVSLSQLNEQIVKINFPVHKIIQSSNELEKINSRLHFILENACISEKIVRTILSMSDKDKSTKIGEKKNLAEILSDPIKQAEEKYKESRLLLKSIEILDIKRILYANQLFEFSKVSKILKKISEFYTLLSKDAGHKFCEYYKLSFYGKKIPEILRNKEYIYRGAWPKRMTDLKEFLAQQFEGPKWLENSIPQIQDIKESKEAYISIVKLIPLTFIEIKEFELDTKTSDLDELNIGTFFPSLPRNMKNYYLENFKNKFYIESSLDLVSLDDPTYKTHFDQIIEDSRSYNIQLPHHEKDLKQLVKEIMLIKGDRKIEIFKVKYKFPFSFCMQEICKTKRLQRKGIDEAIRSTQKLLSEIKDLKQQLVETEDESEVEFFLLKVEAAINSKVSGGVQRYFLSFINKNNIENQKVRPKCLTLYENLKQISSAAEDSIRVLQKFSAAEGRLQVVESANRDLQKNFLQVAKKMIEKSIHQNVKSAL